ncbi:MAG: leucyl aminopeptidase, partial [Gammaproteobacteria bacterium]
MEIKVKTVSPGVRTGCLAVAVNQDAGLSATGKAIDEATGGALSKALKQGDIRGEAGQTLMLHQLPGIAAARVLLVGMGKAGEMKQETFLKAVEATVQAINASGARDAALTLAEEEVPGRDTAWKLRQQARLVETGTYRFDELRSSGDRRPSLRRVDLLVSGRPGAAARRACEQGAAIGRGMNLARDLGNRPANVCTPTYLARQAKALEKRHQKLKVKVLDEKAMHKLGMGALLAVARGSHEPARLILLEYRNGPRGRKPVALVGKGVTFDSGGISIKPSQAMDEMKFDMCGAA